ncbi:serine/threonine-protein kinase [Microbacterium sp. BWT-B31]|uniref:serine/threonine-protein kinase n=1 Tax=Microbacterium sp. BWT-B31 TaxID=3232072 RepID=UPI00352737CE
MSARIPSRPPELPGFEQVRLLGSGGFADVFLYQQLHPRRQVAVKVLLKERLDTESAHGFTEEANLMAQLATHPSIVSVYQAGVSGDGRPYLVMEYCSRPNLQVRHRKERFSVAEALRVGVQIAGAVETAHRAGILHRDIKPANILVTDYGRPALTDFGISATIDSQLTGMSVPWSPPESFRMPPQGHPSSDVYSLAATIYTLLTNRSPFQLPGAPNAEIDVISRIQSMPVPPTGRPDVPPSLEAVLAKAMAKNAADRHQSAIEFARALQRVQIELAMQTTTIDVVEDEFVAEEEDDDEGRTRFRGITSIDAQDAAAPPISTTTGARTADRAAETVTRRTPGLTPDLGGSTVRRPAGAAGASPGRAGVVDDTVRRPGAGAVPSFAPAGAASVDDTVLRPAAAPDIVTEPAPARRRGGIAWAAGTAVALVAAAVVVALVVLPGATADTPDTDRSVQAPVDPIGDEGTVPDVTDLAGQVAGSEVVFSWTNPDPQDGDTYLWRPVVPGESFTFDETAQPTVTVAAAASGLTCIEVLLVREGGRSATQGVEECAP